MMEGREKEKSKEDSIHGNHQGLLGTCILIINGRPMSEQQRGSNTIRFCLANVMTRSEFAA